MFGKKANNSSATSTVPPELRPYFTSHPWLVKLRARLGPVLPVLIALIFAVVIISGALWVRAHRSMPAQGIATRHQQTQTQKTTQPQQSQNTTNGHATSQASSAHTETPASGSLLDTGPGSVPVLATITMTIVGVVIYHIGQRRQARQ